MNSTSFLPDYSLTLAYSLPLLSLSIPLTFAGAFLTLDRTRSFPPQNTKHGWFGAQSSESWMDRIKRNMRLQGGMGGMCAGFIFGIELFTLLALLLPAEVSTLKSLTGLALVVPALLSGAMCSIIAALLQPVALAFSGMAGGLAAALGLSIITHPPLIARYIFLALFQIGFTVTLLIPRTRQVALRVALACLGSFGIAQAISLLNSFDGWSQPFDRLYISDGLNWGTKQEHGITALFSILVAIGCGTDWLLKRKFGQDPDQRWDSLLANFTQSLPDRPGVFEPLPHWYSALLAPFQHATPAQQPLLPGAYQTNLDSKPPLTYMPTRTRTKLQKSHENPRAKSGKALSIGFVTPQRKRDPLVFSPSSLDSDSDSDDNDDHMSRPGNPRSTTDATLVGDPDEKDKAETKPDKAIEVDIGDLADAPPRTILEPRKTGRTAGDWNSFWRAVHHKAGKP